MNVTEQDIKAFVGERGFSPANVTFGKTAWYTDKRYRQAYGKEGMGDSANPAAFNVLTGKMTIDLDMLNERAMSREAIFGVIVHELFHAKQKVVMAAYPNPSAICSEIVIANCGMDMIQWGQTLERQHGDDKTIWPAWLNAYAFNLWNKALDGQVDWQIAFWEGLAEIARIDYLGVDWRTGHLAIATCYDRVVDLYKQAGGKLV